MPVPAADSAVPIAVLVLAWDENTPAVRALVEATQAAAPTVESILVMVPQASAPEVLSAEEYLPLTPTPAPTPPAPLTEPTAQGPSALPSPATATPPAPPTQTAAAANEPDATLPEPPAGASPTKTLTESATPAPLAWSAVRVLRLGSLSLADLSQRAGQPLPSPTWLGVATAPAAPYLGATLEEQESTAPDVALPAALAAITPPIAPEQHPPVVLPFENPAAAPPLYVTAEPESQGADLEADLLPSPAEELAHFELTGSELPAQLAEFEASFSAPQAGWPEALAALQQPDEPEPKPLVPTPPAEVYEAAAGLPARPAAPQYEAPDLNFKIIQYARFAVPVALAEEPYAAIYAPAWPTWLAAQELRQRTGWPLVLHVTALAAGPDELLDTATSWMAELQRQALRRADVILAETQALAQRLRHELNLPAATVHTVPAADAAAIAQALHAARPRPAANLR